MKKVFLLLSVLLSSFSGISQLEDFKIKQLSNQEVSETFTEEIKSELKITFRIFRVYTYTDKTGTHFIVMTENEYRNDFHTDAFETIQGFSFKFEDEKFTLDWSFKDFISPTANTVSEEYSISFWTKYFVLDDYNKDGIIDPILIYGTRGMNEYDDGRIKILVYQNDTKSAIRHQNGTLDYERNTQVDESYYKLPMEIQARVTEIMLAITENNHGIFPAGWQDAMKNKELKFDEN